MKVLRVTCHERKSMYECRGGDHGIHCMHRASPGLLARRNSTPFITHRSINQDDSLFKPPRELTLQPLIKLAPALSLG